MRESLARFLFLALIYLTLPPRKRKAFLGLMEGQGCDVVESVGGEGV